jgi:hypothetical protein
MTQTSGFKLAQRFSHTALGWAIAVVAAGASGCSEDDSSTDAEADCLPSGGSAAMMPTPEPTPAPAPAPAPALPAGTLAVCERPESSYFDAGSSAWYVSCQAKNNVPGDGYVAKLNADATAVVTPRFVTDLDEPKGIRVNDGKLYVSNVSELVTADLASGMTLATTTIVGIDPRVPAVEVSSLNDVAVDPLTGNVYVSDNRNDIVYRFDSNGESPVLLFRGPELEGPNGLLIDERDPATPRLLIAALGPGLDPMRGVTAKLGAVISIDLADLNDGDDVLETTYISQRIGNLDGIEFYGSDLIVSDFFAGRVMRLTPTPAAPAFGAADAQIIRQSLGNSADLGIDVDTGVVMVPETRNGTIVKIELEP